jgi:DNA mismatch endonuclease (patch repair protein)
MDNISPDRRSANMARIRSKDTRPERVVRSALFRLGYRFRKHLKGLPGSPDVAFTKRKKVIFVHGCFWHRHAGCRRAYNPASRKDFWSAKFAATIARDSMAVHRLMKDGWDVMVVWECETADSGALGDRLRAFLGNPRSNDE